MKTTKTTLFTAAFLLAAGLPVCAQTAQKAAKPAVKKAAAAKPAAKPAAKAAPAAVKASTAAPAAAKPAAPAKPAAAQPQAAASSAVKTPFDQAVDKLNDKDASVRRQGADFLGQTRDRKAAPYLLKALEDPAPGVRASAVDGLCQIVYRDAVKKISEMLTQDKDALVRQQAASSLAYMSDQSACPALMKALKDDAVAVRYAAANTLGTMHYAPAEDALLPLLADASMRRVAISALGQLQSRKAGEEISKYLSDPDKYTRVEAVRALGSIGDKAAVPALEKRLDRTEDPYVRVEAALALAKLGQPSGLLTAYEFVKSPDLSLKNQSLEVIGAVGDKRSLQFIEELYASEKDPMAKSMLDFTRQRLLARQKQAAQQ